MVVDLPEGAMRDRLIEAMLKRHNVALTPESRADSWRFHSAHGFHEFPGDQSIDRFRVDVIGLPIGWVYAADGGRNWFAYQHLGMGDPHSVPLHLGPFRTRYAAVRSLGSLAELLPPDEEFPA